MIPAALITGLRSDLPGQVTAQVTEDVYDSPTGKILLIPQGARLIGQYDAQIAFGQSRALLVWNRLIMPNGRSIVLERQPGADTEGYAGLEDEVDNHWGMLFKAAILSTLLSVGSEAGTSNNENDLVAGDPARRVAELQPSRRAGRRALAQHSADDHHPAGLSGARDGHPRSRARTLRGLRSKHGEAEARRDRGRQAGQARPSNCRRRFIAISSPMRKLLARETGQGPIEPAKLIAPMLARFMATDRAFAKATRST